MTFQPGDVVVLKSGGQFMTVAAASDDGVECIWIGEEGELFRETLPLAVLQVVNGDEEEEAEEAEEEEEAQAEASEDQEVRKIA